MWPRIWTVVWILDSGLDKKCWPSNEESWRLHINPDYLRTVWLVDKAKSVQQQDKPHTGYFSLLWCLYFISLQLAKSRSSSGCWMFLMAHDQQINKMEPNLALSSRFAPKVKVIVSELIISAHCPRLSCWHQQPNQGFENMRQHHTHLPAQKPDVLLPVQWCTWSDACGTELCSWAASVQPMWHYQCHNAALPAGSATYQEQQYFMMLPKRYNKL